MVRAQFGPAGDLDVTTALLDAAQPAPTAVQTHNSIDLGTS